MAEQNEGKPRNSGGKGRNRRPRRGPRRGKGQNASQASAPQAQGSGFKGQGRSQNKNRRPKSLTPARITQKYDNLLEQHIVARRKYFEMHGRAQGRQLEKIENNYQKTLDSLRRFESGLKDWQIEVLKDKIDAYPADRQYSVSRELEPKGEDVPFSGEFDDPHLLPTQIEADFSGDTEESIGTMEDYKAYKGV